MIKYKMSSIITLKILPIKCLSFDNHDTPMYHADIISRRIKQTVKKAAAASGFLDDKERNVPWKLLPAQLN